MFLICSRTGKWLEIGKNIHNHTGKSGQAATAGRGIGRAEYLKKTKNPEKTKINFGNGLHCITRGETNPLFTPFWETMIRQAVVTQQQQMPSKTGILLILLGQIVEKC